MPGIRLPMRTAPPPPTKSQNHNHSVWEDDLFSNDPFAPQNNMEKKKPPPRPPPPKIKNSTMKPDIPTRPTHFNRRPTILSTLMQNKQLRFNNSTNETKNNNKSQTALPPPPSNNQNVNYSLIDLTSPCCSPTLTAQSSSDGLSIDSFGSDTTSGNMNLGGESSSRESGFEDDFDIFSNTKNHSSKPDSWSYFDPFSPPTNTQKPSIVNRPIYDSDFLDPLCNGKSIAPTVQTHNKPTIIRAKPARPKAPKDSALLSASLNFTNMKIPSVSSNTYANRIQDNFEESNKIFDTSNYSPPMPSVPPPPPPIIDDLNTLVDVVPFDNFVNLNYDNIYDDEEPFAIALYDFQGTHSDDLSFKVNDKIRLLRQVNDEWLYGKLRCGMEGMFPINFVDIKIPLKKDQQSNLTEELHYATALYDFEPQVESDLGFKVGCKVKILARYNEGWLYGEINGKCGQFPSNYVDHIPNNLPIKPS